MTKTVILTGAAGGGLNSIQDFLEQSFHKKGYYFYSYRNYMSRVRGGFNYMIITLSDRPLKTCEPKGDYVVSLDDQVYDHLDELLKPGGQILVMDSDHKTDAQDIMVVQFPKEEVDRVFAHPNASGMVALGYLAKVFGLDEADVDAIEMPWSEKVNASNLAAVKYGFVRAEKAIEPPLRADMGYQMDGNQAIALGALAGGLNFYCAYPMSPATGILQYITNNEKAMHVFTEQAEDEIAAAVSITGAAAAGARAMTATSGGGFALMTEGIGLAAIAETPVVIANVMRPGPATGLPTRTDQGDFYQALGAAQGEFPKIILAPDSVSDCLYTSNRAMDLAHRFRLPVILLSDQYLANSSTELPGVDYDQLVNNSYLAPKGSDYTIYDKDVLEGNAKYAGYDESLLLYDSHIHLEDGFYSESAEVTNRYKQRVLDKLALIANTLKPPTYYGADDPDVLLVSWGSNRPILEDAIDRWDKSKLGLLHFTDLYPLNPQHLAPYFGKAKTVVNVEMNGFNQFGKYLRGQTGWNFDHSINRYDGRPLNVDYVIERLEEIHESL